MERFAQRWKKEKGAQSDKYGVKKCDKYCTHVGIYRMK